MSVTSGDPSYCDGQDIREAAVNGDTASMIQLLDNGAPFIIDAVSDWIIFL